MLVDHPVLDRPERHLLLDQALRALDIAGSEHAGRQPDRIPDDESEILDRLYLLAGEIEALFLLGLEPVGEIELDDVARMFEIAREQHDVERAAALARR